MQTNVVTVVSTSACESCADNEQTMLPFGTPSMDPALALLALMIDSRSSQSGVARQQVEQQQKLVDELRTQIQEQLRKAEDSQHHAGFFSRLGHLFGGDIAAVCGIIAAVAVTVASGGTGAAAVVAIVASSVSATAEAGQRLGLNPKLCAILSAVGGLLSVVGGNVGGVSNMGMAFARTAQGLEGLSSATGTGLTYGSHLYEADAADAQANVRNCEGLEDQAWASVDMAVALIQRITDDVARATTAVSSLEDNASRSRGAIISQLGAA